MAVSVELAQLRSEYEQIATEQVAMEGLLTHMFKANPTFAVNMLTKAASTIAKQSDELEGVKTDLKASGVTQGEAQGKLERMRGCYNNDMRDKNRRLAEVYQHATQLSDSAHPCI